jgi:hypothetical protein
MIMYREPPAHLMNPTPPSTADSTPALEDKPSSTSADTPQPEDPAAAAPNKGKAYTHSGGSSSSKRTRRQPGQDPEVEGESVKFSTLGLMEALMQAVQRGGNVFEVGARVMRADRVISSFTCRSTFLCRLYMSVLLYVWCAALHLCSLSISVLSYILVAHMHVGRCCIDCCCWRSDMRQMLHGGTETTWLGHGYLPSLSCQDQVTHCLLPAGHSLPPPHACPGAAWVGVLQVRR